MSIRSRITAALVICLATCSAASAQGLIVTLPDTSAMPRDSARNLLTELAQVDVMATNCDEMDLTPSEQTLLSATGERIADRLGMTDTQYDRRYYAPALELLNDPGACARIAPTARPLIERLGRMGGLVAPTD